MIKNMLDYVVPILVLDQLLRVHQQLFQKTFSLARKAMLQETLNNTTSIRMTREFQDLKYITCNDFLRRCLLYHLTTECMENKLQFLRVYNLYTLLYHMVSILILHKLFNVALKLLNIYSLLKFTLFA